MKKTILFFLLLTGLEFKAQQFNLTKGVDFEKADWSSRMIEHDDKGFYYLTHIGGAFSPNYILRKFDLVNAKLIYERVIDLKGDDYLGGGAYMVNVFNKNGKILAFSKCFKGKKNHLMMQEFSSETGEPLGKPVIVDEMADAHAYIISEAVVDFKINFSPDNKKMLVVAEVKQAAKIQKVFAKLYDTKTYKKLWEKEPVAVYGKSTVSSFDYCVDNYGNFSYLFIYIRSEDDGFNRFGKQDVAHAVGISSFGSTKNNVIEITSEEIITIAPTLEIINNVLVCTGEYNGEEEDGKAYGGDKKVGFFLLTIDGKVGELKTKSYEYFTPEIHKKLSYKEKGFTSSFAGHKTYTNYKTLSIGGVFYQIKLRTLNDDYDWECQGMEILIYKYDSKNKLEWIKMIPRSTFKEFTAVNYFAAKNLNLLYYEDPQNLELFPNTEVYDPGKYKQVKSGKKAVLIYASIDEKGNIIRQKIDINEENLALDKLNYDHVIIKEQNSIIVPVNKSKSERRYDIIKIED